MKSNWVCYTKYYTNGERESGEQQRFCYSGQENDFELSLDVFNVHDGDVRVNLSVVYVYDDGCSLWVE